MRDESIYPSVAPITVDGVVVGTISVGLDGEVDTSGIGAEPWIGATASLGDQAGAPQPHGRSVGGHEAQRHNDERRGPTFRRGVGPGSKSRSDDDKPKHFTTDDVRKAVAGKDVLEGKHFTTSDVAAAVKGGTPGAIDRSRFNPEMTEATTHRLAAMVAGEIADQNNEKAQTVQAETAFNRAQYRGHSLEQALWGTAEHGNAGYYPPQTYAHGNAYIASHPAWYQNFKENILPKVMAGSNESDIGYGPMTGNASGDVARNQFARGTKGYPLPGGDTYFREGPFTNALARLPGKPEGVESLSQDKPIGVTRFGSGSSPSVTSDGDDLSGQVRRGSSDFFSSGRAAASGVKGGVGQNLVKITSPSGHTTFVNAEAAPHFQGFINDLEKSGYNINSLGGFSQRQKVGGGSGWSEHAYGNAIDINPGKNPQFGSTDMPKNISDMAARHGLTWGGDWSPQWRDPMHFEWTGAGRDSQQANK